MFILCLVKGYRNGREGKKHSDEAKKKERKIKKEPVPFQCMFECFTSSKCLSVFIQLLMLHNLQTTNVLSLVDRNTILLPKEALIRPNLISSL